MYKSHSGGMHYPEPQYVRTPSLVSMEASHQTTYWPVSIQLTPTGEATMHIPTGSAPGQLLPHRWHSCPTFCGAAQQPQRQRVRAPTSGMATHQYRQKFGEGNSLCMSSSPNSGPNRRRVRSRPRGREPRRGLGPECVATKVCPLCGSASSPKPGANGLPN